MQTSSFIILDAARKMAFDLQKAGYKVDILGVYDKSAKLWYVVHVGPFNNKKDSQTTSSQISKMFNILPAIIILEKQNYQKYLSRVPKDLPTTRPTKKLQLTKAENQPVIKPADIEKHKKNRQTKNDFHKPFLTSLKKAVENNPAILVAKNKLQVNRVKHGLSKVELLPTISMGFKADHIYSSWNDGSEDSSKNPFNISLSLSQPIIDYKKWLSLDKANYPIKQAGLTLLIEAEKIFFRVVQETINILQAQAVLERSQNNLELAKNHLRSSKLRYEAGELTQTDVSQAESRVASIQAELITTNNQIEISMASFTEVTGDKVPIGLSIPPVLPTLLEELEKAPIEHIDNRADIALAINKLDEAKYSIKLEDSEKLPVVTFTSSASQTWNTGSESTPGVNNAVNLSIGVSLPIDARGKFAKQNRKAVFAVDQQQAKVDLIRQTALKEVKHALLGLSSARAKDQALKTVETTAKIALSGVEKEFLVGTRGSPDLLDAQNELFSAQRDLVKSYYALLLEQYKLLKAKGHLTLTEQIFDLKSTSTPIFTKELNN
ncbi:MAG: TolC family outer membrane protein [Magnetococcales bacterium]|nr:TolC family outer membrane protein [Magnetococcales bacterium]